MRTASTSPYGTCRKPCGSGSKPAWYFGCAVAVSVASVRPWKDDSKVSSSYRSLKPRSICARRASLISASLASAPELQKKARAPGSPEERILDAALESYRERGIAATSLQAVARRADVSAATVLNHFGSADELARVVVGRLSDAIRIPDDREWTEHGRNRRVRRLVSEMIDSTLASVFLTR